MQFLRTGAVKNCFATAILILMLFSCKKQGLGKYEFNHSMDLSNQMPENFKIWNILSDESISRKLADIENENSFEHGGERIEYLEMFCIQNETENKISDDFGIVFLDGHSYYLITLEVGDIYDFESSFDGESASPACTKTVVLKDNCYGYLKWWKVNDNDFKRFEYSVSDMNGNKKRTQLERD